MIHNLLCGQVWHYLLDHNRKNRSNKFWPDSLELIVTKILRFMFYSIILKLFWDQSSSHTYARSTNPLESLKKVRPDQLWWSFLLLVISNKTLIFYCQNKIIQVLEGYSKNRNLVSMDPWIGKETLRSLWLQNSL